MPFYNNVSWHNGVSLRYNYLLSLAFSTKNNYLYINIMYKILITLSLVVFATPSFAYVDPGTGSIIISAIVGFFAGVGFFIKKILL